MSIQTHPLFELETVDSSVVNPGSLVRHLHDPKSCGTVLSRRPGDFTEQCDVMWSKQPWIIVEMPPLPAHATWRREEPLYSHTGYNGRHYVSEAVVAKFECEEVYLPGQFKESDIKDIPQFGNIEVTFHSDGNTVIKRSGIPREALPHYVADEKMGFGSVRYTQGHRDP